MAILSQPAKAGSGFFGPEVRLLSERRASSYLGRYFLQFPTVNVSQCCRDVPQAECENRTIALISLRFINVVRGFHFSQKPVFESR